MSRKFYVSSPCPISGKLSNFVIRHFRSSSLLRAEAEEDYGDGAEEDFRVEPKGPVIDVFEVERDPAVEARDVAAPADLPEAGDAGLHGEAAALGGCLEFFHLVDWQRTGADEAHVAFEHVPNLGKLIER